MLRGDPLKRQREPCDAVFRREAEPGVKVRDGLASLRVTNANVAAAKAGMTVELPPGGRPILIE